MTDQYPQNPGGYGGAPPPGYGPQGAPPGAPAGGPPGGMPYGAAPQGYPGNPPQIPAQGSGKKGQVWLALGVGCGLFTLLAIGGTVLAMFWIRNRASAAVEEVQQQLASASAAIAASPVGSALNAGGTNAVPSGDCAIALACCKAIAAKATGNATAAEACEVFNTAGYPTAACAASLKGYREVSKTVGVTCE